MNRPLRVAVDARSLLCAQPRGEGKSLLRLYQEMLSLDPQLQPVFFGDERASRYQGPLPSSVKVRGTGIFGDRLNLWEDLYFPWAARRAGCAVIHSTSSGCPRWAGLPVVMTVHDLIPLLFDDGQDAAARRLFARRLGHGMRQARSVIAVSEHTRQDLLRTVGSAAPVVTVHWGMDPAVRRPGNEAPPLVLAFGGEARRKNTEYTLDRFAAAARRLPALRMSMTGINSTRLRQDLQARIAQAGLAGRIDLLGFVSEEELDSLFSRACLLLYLSRYEGFGVPVAEALSRGLPVVASDSTSVAELLAGVPGAFDLAHTERIEEAIVTIAADDTRWREMADAQSSVPGRFLWRNTALRTMELLRGASR